MLEFKKESGVAIAVAPTGLKVIAFGNGFQCGTNDINPITGVDVVKIYTTLQDCGVDGLPVNSLRLANEYTVNIPVSELAGIPLYNENGFSQEVIDIYVDKLVEMTTVPVIEPIIK